MASLHAGIEQALGEFFAPTTATAEKRVLEEQLQQFKLQEDALEHACGFLQAASQGEAGYSAYLLWFSASILEDTVRLRWAAVDESVRSSVREFAFNLVLGDGAGGGGMPRFVVAKLIDVVVLIGRIEWPDTFPSFFDDVLGAASVPLPNAQHGLAVLAVVLQEGMLAPDARRSSVVPALSAMAFRVEVGRRVPVVVGLLGSQLEAVCEAAGGSTPEPQGAVHETADVVLRVLREVAAGAPLHDQLDGRLLDGLFRCVDWCESDLSTAALQCVAELTGKPCVPLQLETALASVAARVVECLQSAAALLASASADPDAASPADRLADGYLEALGDIIRGLLEHHLRRLERHSTTDAAGGGGGCFPMGAFLEGFFSFSFNQPSAAGFLDCLSLWDMFVSHVAASASDGGGSPGGGGGPTGYERHAPLYLAGLGQLAVALVERTQFSSSAALLLQLDDSDIAPPAAGGESSSRATDYDSDDDFFSAHTKSGSPAGGTELEQYVETCVALVSKIARLPNGAAAGGASAAQTLVETLCPALQSAWDRFTQGLQAGNQTPAEAEMFEQCVWDLSTCLRLVGATVGYFLAEGDNQLAVDLLRTSIETASVITGQRLYTRGNSYANLLVSSSDTVARFAPWIESLAKGSYLGFVHRVPPLPCLTADSPPPPPPRPLQPPYTICVIQISPVCVCLRRISLTFPPLHPNHPPTAPRTV